MLLTQPYTREELRSNMDEDGYVEGKVIVDFNQILDIDLEGFLDCLSERLTGSLLLMNIDYDIVGIVGPNELVINVSGNVSNIIDTE